jgi:hypothetical protein
VTTPLLSELREPPVVGNFYMVPVIRRFHWHELLGDWPVLGPLHEDKHFFDFEELHYHLDARFLTKAQQAHATRHGSRNSILNLQGYEPLIVAISGAPLSNWYSRRLPKGRPVLMRRRCTRETYESMVLKVHHVARGRLEGLFGEVARPIRKRDGRLLCPHRKVDLSQFVPDKDGIVTCPLHGLRVRCAA